MFLSYNSRKKSNVIDLNAKVYQNIEKKLSIISNLCRKTCKLKKSMANG